MMKLLPTRLLLLAIFLVLAACGPKPPAPELVPEPPLVREFSIDPRLGFDGTASDETVTSYERALLTYRRGNGEEADRLFAEVEQSDPTFAPATLARAALAAERDEIEIARELVRKSETGRPQYTAALLYGAEIARRGGDLRGVFERYSRASRLPNSPPWVAERLAESRRQLFEQLAETAASTTDPEAGIRALRDALAINPASEATRISLVKRLVSVKRFDEARGEAEPLISTGAPLPEDLDVALAEIDAGRGRYQEALLRYERLTRKNPTYASRFAEVKERWQESNLPKHVRRAIEKSAIDRTDLAILLYWKVGAVRFARNLSSPPIATDIANVIGKDELVRALALRLFYIDPLTRRADPYRSVTGVAFKNVVTQVLTMARASCAHPPASSDVPPPGVLSSCGIPTDGLGSGQVSGRAAARVLERVDAVARLTK